MLKNSAIRLYLLITFLIITPLSTIALTLRLTGVVVNDFVGFIAMALGGISTAIAGAAVARRSGKIGGYRELFWEFFRIKVSFMHYLLVALFLLIVYGTRIVGGTKAGLGWLAVPLFFVRALLFGGIEEIGWRYVFQPELEKKFSFIRASFVTFACWAIWHLMFNMLDGSLFTMSFVGGLNFLLGLFASSVALGCVFRVTKSLWLCVFFHALSNALIMALPGLDVIGNTIVLLAVVAVSMFIIKS